MKKEAAFSSKVAMFTKVTLRVNLKTIGNRELVCCDENQTDVQLISSTISIYKETIENN